MQTVTVIRADIHAWPKLNVRKITTKLQENYVIKILEKTPTPIVPSDARWCWNNSLAFQVQSFFLVKVLNRLLRIGFSQII